MSQSYEPTQKNEQPLPKPCQGGCGFFGSDDQMGYCSVCYQKCVPLEQRSQHEQSQNSAQIPKPNEKEHKAEINPTKKEQSKKNRCWQCQKKYHWLEDLIANVAMYFAAHIVFLTFMNVILTINLHSKRNWMQ